MPDMDIDFSVAGREQVINYVAEKYGRDRVAQIITFGTMMARAAIRDAGRVLEIPYGTVDRIAKLVPEGVKVYLDDSLKPGQELRAAYDSDPLVKKLRDKLLAQENEIEKYEADIKSLQAKADKQRRDFDTYLVGLTIEK